MAEDGSHEFAEISDGKFQAEGAVRSGVGFLFGVPALLLDPRRYLWGELQYHLAGGAALHDAEMLAGIIFDIRQVGGDGGKGYTHTGTDGSALPCRRQRTHVSILGRRQTTAAAVDDRCGGVGGCNRRSDGDARG